MYKYLLIIFGLMAVLLNSATAAEVLGKNLEIYGKVHLSVDSSDKDDPASSNDGFSVSSNSSRLGFKGEYPVGEMTFLYQFEQEVVLDETGKNFATRNSYGGLKGNFGKVIVGFHDTPFKKVGSVWGLFSDTVGDRRTVSGASYTEGNQLNERAQNAIMYEFKNKTLIMQAMYAVDPESGNDGLVDNNDKDVTSVGLRYNNGPLALGAAYETWQGHSKAGNANATRLTAKYKVGMANLGVMYETIDSDNMAQWNRDVYGFNVDYKLNQKTTLKAQYMIADDVDTVADTGATSVSLGAFYKLDKKANIYLVYASTDNDSNAGFQGVDGGHGDEVKTINGGNPNAISAGFVFKF